MHLNAYLSFDGNCEEAFRYYEKHLGGKITAMLPYSEEPKGGSGMAVPDAWKKKIMHASMTIGESVLMGGDPPPPYYRKPQGVSVNISMNDVDKAERMFGALADGGEITMPFAQTFWVKRFGMVTDKFGVQWMINCE